VVPVYSEVDRPRARVIGAFIETLDGAGGCTRWLAKGKGQCFRISQVRVMDVRVGRQSPVSNGACLRMPQVSASIGNIGGANRILTTLGL